MSAINVTPYELVHLSIQPFLPILYRQVRQRLLDLSRASTSRLQVLDVGGRTSRVTIGVAADVTITDLPRESSVQHELNLGLTDAMMKRVKARRSNVRAVELDDMSKTRLPAEAFDCVVAVEVLEHVDDDAAFVRNVRSVLRPGGVFLMTTPNGDFKPIPHRDHRRHYRRDQLAALLGQELESVEVDYAVVAGRSRQLGMRGWTLKRPVRTALSMGGNLVNGVLSTRPDVRGRAQGTHHLIATAIKR